MNQAEGEDHRWHWVVQLNWDALMTDYAPLHAT